ncbi:glycoside hydrolase family 2 TIM barrel-domain containing protein [Mucilaginibacter sp. PAMB04168]|uniref:glycoside hydrolase family 2 protein n=1 Tax=Mucilaginibacter sp. PAMB04168 TaxID=3138567 RepID=UPI0031F71E8C
MNGTWKFLPVGQADKLKKEQLTNPELPVNPQWDPTPIKIPSGWNVNSFARGDGSGGDFLTYPSYPKKWESVRAGWLMKKISYKKEWKGKRVFIHFDAIDGYSKIFLNGHSVGENMDVFLPFEIDITQWLKDGQDNELMVWVADAELFNQPGKFGRRIYVAGSFWGQHIKGIWQDVNLVIKPAVNIQNSFVKPQVDQDELLVDVTVSNTSEKQQEVAIEGDIYPWINQAGQSVADAPEPKWKLGDKVLSIKPVKVVLAAKSQQIVSLKVKINGALKKWVPEQPNLYGLVLTTKHGKNTGDKQYTRFGWRQFTVKGSQYLLNGKPIVFNGDSWHFMGIPQMTRRYAWAWYKLLQDSHANAVRLHAQPYPQFYLDMADEMGICVLDETGMWASDGGPKINSEEYWKNSEEHLRRFVLRDRNHPSVLGWSVCNENVPVAMGVFRSPDSLVKRQVAEINKWMKITRELDPSRPWISGDGESQAELNSPIIIGHYGGSEANYRNLSSKGKIWGIGEAGMAYYATPLQSATYNGNRSYVSQQGRMEGVAMEATKLINMLKKFHSSYNSVFNIVWYGIKPLELGLKDTTRAPQPSDGIFFGPYQEGKPGVQPERLGPYTTTLNPGYDTSLPLYKPWPLFDAIKASFADTGFVAQKPSPVRTEAAGNKLQFSAVTLLSTDKDSVISHLLHDMGISNFNNFKLKPTAKTLLIIDGVHPLQGAQFLALERSVISAGGKVMIWGTSTESLPAINAYLPSPVALTTRNATSFTTGVIDPILGNMDNADFYFSEITNDPVMTHGLTGAFVEGGKVILSAANPNWLRWNKRAEYLKTAAILRSEREAKQAGGALVLNGNIYYCALDPQALSRTSFSLVRQLFLNLGFSFSRANNRLNAINSNGSLENALMLGSFSLEGRQADSTRLEILKHAKDGTIYPGGKASAHFWEIARATNGVFDLGSMNLQGPKENAVTYASFWIYSPRSLSDLLAEPDMPKLDMLIGADHAYQAFLNGKIISESNKDEGVDKLNRIPALSLEKGWNHFLIKVAQKKGDWKLALKFESNQKSFFSEIKSQIAY